MVVMKSDENQIRSFDAYTVSNAKGFLNGLLPDVEAADLELKIKDQEDVVSKAEKKQKNLESDLSDMEKRLRKLQDDIEQNKKDQESQKKEIINQRESLDALRSKRKATI
jgi:peptidoglycan hydrolase CwlO-like protein